MRTWSLSLLAVAATLCVPATASAAFEHVVAPGESLSSVAAADGLSVSQLAAANGLSPAAELVAGTDLAIPSQGAPATAESAAAPAQSDTETATPATAGGYQVQPGDTLSAIAARYGVSVGQLAAANGLNPNGVLLAGSSLSVGGGSSATPTSSESTASGAAAGGYQVQPGDTLSAIAARYGVSVGQLAAANGLNPNGVLLAGSTLGVDGASASGSPSDPQTASAPAGTGAQPTDESVSPSDVATIASQNGVSPSLAEAIADQESGFNNNEVSSTGAVGEMQIEPGTWSYINSLGGPALSPDSANDNVLGGVELLHSLLDQTGGDAAMAAAGYYQGLASVRAHGMYSDTQSYVNDVMALQGRYGG